MPLVQASKNCMGQGFRAIGLVQLSLRDLAVTDTPPKLLLIGSNTPTTWIIYNRLVREFGLFEAIIEEKVAKSSLLKNRARKLGWFSVLDQIAFVALLRPIINYQASRRIRTICKLNDLEAQQPYSPAVKHLANINSPESIALINAAAPDVVIVSGTRILKKDILRSTRGLFLNCHQGITPQYRGGHGGYWALYAKDPARCGVTVHVVDEGIDTGNIVSQATITPEAGDSFATYPYLQTAAALPILVKAIRDAAAGKLETRAVSGNSAIWYHPGFWQYVSGWLRGVR